MAVPGVGQKLEKMFRVKEKKFLARTSKQLENMAKGGNITAQTVIGISNEMNVQAVGEV